MIAEYDAAGKLLARYVYGPGLDEPLVILKGGKSYSFHADSLGSIVALTDSRGQLVEQYRYDPFGTPTILAPNGQPRTKEWGQVLQSHTKEWGLKRMGSGKEWGQVLQSHILPARLGRWLGLSELSLRVRSIT